MTILYLKSLASTARYHFIVAAKIEVSFLYTILKKWLQNVVMWMFIVSILELFYPVR